MRRLAILLATLVALGGLSLLVPVGALAGSNGQELEFYDTIGYAYTVAVNGDNQSGQYVSHAFSTPYQDNYFSGWWWKGYLALDEYGASNNYLGEEWTVVPTSESSNWWCFEDFHGASSSGATSCEP
jgi:hypothetical protein